MERDRTRDMTTGDPIRLILSFAVPLFIGNVFQQVYSLVDTMIAGHILGDGAIAAIGATSAFYSLIIGFASGMNSGYGIVVSRLFGARDDERFKQSVAGMLLLDLAVTVALTVLALALLRPLMVLIHVSEALFDRSYRYIAIILAGMFTTNGYNLCAVLLRSVGNSRIPLYYLILASLLNLAFDALFIMGLRTDVGGAAVATVLAQGCSVALCGRYIWKHYRDILPEKRHFRLGRRLVGEMLTTGVSMGLMQSVYAIGSVMLQGAINQLGESVITAHTTARRIVEMLMQPLGTIATANATFVSQNWGAGRYDRIRSTLRRVFGLELLWSALSILFLFTLGDLTVRLLIGTSDPAVIANAAMNLRINASLFPPLGILLALRTAMQSMERKIAPVLSSCIELGMKVLSALFVVPQYGYLAASWTEPATWVVCLAFLMTAFLLCREKLHLKPPAPEGG